eukprot:g28867.t1
MLQSPVPVDRRSGVAPWPTASRLTFTPPPRSFPWPCAMSPVVVNGLVVHTSPSSNGEAESPAASSLTPSRQVICAVPSNMHCGHARTMFRWNLQHCSAGLTSLTRRRHSCPAAAFVSFGSCAFSSDSMTGCLRGGAKASSNECPVRAASWEAFAAIRQTARDDAYFAGCEARQDASTLCAEDCERSHFMRRPSTLAAICIHFSRLRPSEHKPTEKFLQRILWRADRLIYDLAGRELLSLLEVFALRGLREHDPRRPDLFIEAVPRLQKEVWDFGLSDVRRIAALYKQLNLRHEGLFEALGQRLEELLEETRTSVQKQNTQLTRQKRAPAGLLTTSKSHSNVLLKLLTSAGTAASAAVMTFLGACGRLNIVPLQAQNLLEVVGPTARAKKDLPRLAALAQLAAKFGCADTGEANRILLFVSAAFEEAVPDLPTRKGYASQAVYGQLLLALIFDESRCEIRDRTLVASVQAVFATFGSALDSLDERLARQLQVVDLACRVERPGVLEILETKGLTPFLEGVKSLEEIPSVLPKCSSQQHLQVSGVLQELGVKHRMEEKLQPYIADVRLTRRQRLIEIDGPLHFVGGSKRYDMKTSLKHRLLTKQGWDVHHIAWNDWPVQHHSRLNYVARLLRTPPPQQREAEVLTSWRQTVRTSSPADSPVSPQELQRLKKGLQAQGSSPDSSFHLETVSALPDESKSRRRPALRSHNACSTDLQS